MAGIGKTTLAQSTGRPVRLSADGYPIWKPIGVTVAWELVTAATSASVLLDGTPINIGEKYIEIGTPMVLVTKGEVQTITIDATGGTFDITVTRSGVARTITAFAWNGSAALLKSTLEALDIIGEGRVTSVALASLVYTVTFNATLGVVTMATSATNLTGGGGTAVVATTTTASTSGGKYAPCDTSQSDGRQTLTRGACGLLDSTIKNTELTVMGANVNNELVGLIEGGLVWTPRLKVGGTNQGTLTNLLAALPELRLTPTE